MSTNDNETVFAKAPGKMADFNEMSDMLFDYICELNSLEPKVEIRNKEQLMREYFHSGSPAEYFLFKKGDETIGFGIIGFSNNCHSLADIYIEEFYIKPEYRRNGYGEKLAAHVIGESKAICFYVIKKNCVAKSFWKAVLKNWEYVDIPDENETPYWLHWYFCKKKEESTHDC